MAQLDVSLIRSWHAHVYFDAASRDEAWAFRDAVVTHFGDKIAMGRFHERPVGPHPQWSYQIEFQPDRFVEVAGWLCLNHGKLAVFLHPNTDDELRDHRDSAVWIGKSYELNLDALR
jgi:aromatic ring-cleaving dioxygenase